MSYYLLLAFDEVTNCFFSHRGQEKKITMRLLEKSSYYLRQDEEIILVLKEDWIDVNESIGGLFKLDGTMIEEIPYPGISHGKFAINGLVEGDNNYFKFIVEPYSNSNSYFLNYYFMAKSFERVGNIVR